MEITIAAFIITSVALILVAGAVGWFIRDRRQRRLEQRVIDLRDRIGDPQVRVPPSHARLVKDRQRV